MIVAAVVFCILCGVVTLVWISRHLAVSRERRGGFVLTEGYPDGQANMPSVSVVLAAKDEEAVIDKCVRSILGQDYPNFDMTVINDRSADRTAEIVKSIEKQDQRLRLLNIESLPAGWCGKNNAMQTGIAQTRGEWILMIDADCKQTSPKSLRSAVSYAMNQQADFLSVLPNLDMVGFWENAVQPVCGGLLMIWFPPDKVNSDSHPHAYANGAFMLIKRSAYQAAGTHEAVKDRVNEDIHMAYAVKKAGLRLRVVREEGLFNTRMYTSLGQIVRGWGRIFFGTFCTLRRVALTMAVLLVSSLVPYLTMLVAGLVLALGAGPERLWMAALGMAMLAAGMQLTVIYRFYDMVGANRRMFWSYPVGCAVAMYCLCISVSKLRKGAVVSWRGTSYAKN